MELKIGDRDYTIYMGIKALDYLDQIYKLDVDGVIELGMGLNLLYSALQSGNVTGLVHFIKAGTITEVRKPSDREIEEYIGSLNAKEYDEFMKAAVDELGKQPLTKGPINKLEKAVKEAQREKKVN